MADDAGKSMAAKSRIINHMNADHKDTLVAYLEHYCHLPYSMAKSAQLESIDLDHMIIDASKTRYFVPLDPPMKALSEARQRTVEMDDEAIEGLGRSKIIVDEYRFPSGPYLIIFGLILVAWAMNYSGRNFVPGAFFYEKILRGNELLARVFSFTQPLTLFIMVSVHTVESIWFDWSRLSKHKVKRFRLMWCLWMGSCLLEGRGPLVRFDSVVRSKIEQKKNKLH
jgi:hypothetical protein